MMWLNFFRSFQKRFGLWPKKILSPRYTWTSPPAVVYFPSLAEYTALGVLKDTITQTFSADFCSCLVARIRKPIKCGLKTLLMIHACTNSSEKSKRFILQLAIVTPSEGVTRLYGARGKYQIRRPPGRSGAPMVEVWRPYGQIRVLSKANLLYWRKYLWHCWDFSAPLQWFSAPIVNWRPGNLCPPCPPSSTRLLLSIQFI